MSNAWTKALVLKSTPYKERDHIISVFTIDQGLESFYLKKKIAQIPSLIEVSYYTSSSLKRAQSIETLESFDHLRSDFSTIKTTGKILHYFQKIQLPGAKSKRLFLFMHHLLHWLEKEHLLHCLSLFFIKILKFEGSFLIKNRCSICGQTLQTFFIDSMEWVCKNHTNSELYFNLEEIQVMKKLESETNKKTLFELEIPSSLVDKLELLFCMHFQWHEGEMHGNLSGRRNSNLIQKL